MEQHRHAQTIVVKIGSQVLCTPGDESSARLDDKIIASLAAQVSMLSEEGCKVLVVSSGAVAAGSGFDSKALRRVTDPVVRKQVQAATGQVLLMERWRQEFAKHGHGVAQVLTSKSDFQSRRHYLNMRACLEGLIQAEVIPVVNENDVVATTELMFTDNDELAGLLAGMVDADLLIMLSSVPGLYLGDTANGEIISRWDESIHRVEEIVREGTSRLGRGGMHSKLGIAIDTASLGTEVVIANGRTPGVLGCVARGEELGTRFPASKAVSRTKRWLASAGGHATAFAVINQGAVEALMDDNRLTSLLPVGVVSIEGSFDKGDVLLIRDREGNVLGCGKSQFDHVEAEGVIGKHGQRPLVHYDYLYLSRHGE
ncbi:MAG TPA: glutamate 5-kinase [Xanthomonadales bacterium]|nr:glutamate 5-kinase [Xanthomonadales bacterium]